MILFLLASDREETMSMLSGQTKKRVRVRFFSGKVMTAFGGVKNVSCGNGDSFDPKLAQHMYYGRIQASEGLLMT